MEEIENSTPSVEAPRKVRIILLALIALSALALILVLIFAPEAKFDYIFGTFPWFGVLIIATLVFGVILITTYDEHRESKSYLSPDGELDTTTPRDYTPLRVSPLSKILGRANIFYPQKNLDEFRFADGVLYIRNSAGHEVEGPLEELTYKYKFDKDKATGDLYIYQYHITDKDGNKVQFNRHNTLFNEEEYLDMEMILALCGTVKESKLNKLIKHADSIMGILEDPGSVADMAMDKVGQLAKKKLINRLNTGEESKSKNVLKKVWKYGLWVLLGLYALAVIYVNIEPLFSHSDNITDEYCEVYEDEVETVAETDESSYEEAVKQFLSMSNGTIYNCYTDDDEPFMLSFNGNSGRYLDTRGVQHYLRMTENVRGDGGYAVECNIFTLAGTNVGKLFAVITDGEQGERHYIKSEVKGVIYPDVKFNGLERE